MVNTFLPVPSYKDSALLLDVRRLGKQRVETLQLLRANLGLTKGWVNHPAAKMWRGYEYSLAQYGLAVCEVWRSRGYKDTCLDKIEALILDHGLVDTGQQPPWLGDVVFHDSHKSNLLRKDPVFYGAHGWEVPHDLPYLWPVSKES